MTRSKWCSPSQDPKQSVPLLQGKPTLTRAYVSQLEPESWTGATGTLSGEIDLVTGSGKTQTVAADGSLTLTDLPTAPTSSHSRAARAATSPAASTSSSPTTC